jgi:hypothetical protein
VDFDEPDGPPGRSAVVGAGDRAQRTLLRHFAGSPLAMSASADAAVSWVITGVASNIHNGVVAARLSADSADAAISATVQRLTGIPRSGTSARRTPPADLPQRLFRAGWCRNASAW